MPSFRKRNNSKELLDGDNIPFKDIQLNMMELDRINSLLGGHAITNTAVEQFLENSGNEIVHIAEIGCGGGDNLRSIKKWADKNQKNVALTGIDINSECIAFARQHEENKQIRFIHSDYRDVVFEQKPTLVFSSLFCHHFTDQELKEQLKWMHRNSTHGFFINDLHRHPLAYYSISLLTRLFSKSYLVKNDAPISVLRGFTRDDWKRIFRDAGLDNYSCHWRWAFRWLVTCIH
jgi:ubiquinone/menaquinone biosynthesis C-methylase UbiE